MTTRAVIIKGPKADSRSYITVLPDRMEDLLEKAKGLFSVPPNNTPHFTLGTDTAVIVLPDFLPLIREREVLIFRWTPDTPRSSLRRSVAGLPFIQAADDSITGSVGEENSLTRAARGVRWDESVVSNEEKNKRQTARVRGSRELKDSAISRHRAEYAKQKIQEQQEIRQREDAERASEAAATTGDDPFKVTAASDQGKRDNNSEQASLSASSATISDDLLVSGSSPPSYSSSPPANLHEEEQQNSSPLASPTRDVRGARKTDHDKMWMMSLGGEKGQADVAWGEEESKGSAEEETVVQVEEESKGSTAETLAQVEDAEKPSEGVDKGDDDVAKGEGAAVEKEVDAEDLEEEQAVEQATSPERVHEVHVRDLPAYQTMKSVVNQLSSHPSSHCVRQLCQEEVRRFCQERNRPVVDLFTISDAITLGMYGRENPLKGFGTDLKHMWSNTRLYYGPQSPQAQSAGILETFSGILLEEWQHHNTVRANRPRPSLAARPYSTPMSRGEKHNSRPGQDTTPKTQQQAYFASLMAKTGFAHSTASPSRMLAKLGQSLKRPAAYPSPQMQRPAKKVHLATEVQTATTSLPTVTVTTDKDVSQQSKESTAPPATSSMTTRRAAAQRATSKVG